VFSKESQHIIELFIKSVELLKQRESDGLNVH